MVHAASDATLAVDTRVEASPSDVVRLSRSLLDLPIAASGLLAVRVLRGGPPVLTIGAFDRAASVRARAGVIERAGDSSGEPVATVARGSGGIPVRFDVDSVWVGLALESTTAFTDANPSTIVNRHVRPLLRALAREKVPASYGGRDWIASVKSPIAWVGFQHDARTNRAVFEALVAIRSPFASAERPAFLGKTPTALDAVAGRSIDPMHLRGAVIEAYVSEFAAKRLERPPTELAELSDHSREDPAFTATVAEAIGLVGAGPTKDGYVGVGGEFGASRDAVAELNFRLTQIDWRDGAAVDEAVASAFDHANVVVDGVRSLGSFREAVIRVSL